MTRRALFVPAVFASAIVLFAAGCSGGGALTANVQPVQASRAQLAQLAASPIDAGGSLSDSAPDTGTLLPLQNLTGRNTLSVSSCASTAACIGGTNTSTGPGVAGVSSLGKGVTGTTTFASTSSSNGQYGVYGQDSSASGSFDAGVYGLSARGVGTSGKSTSSYGVRGTSSSSIGVYGVSTNYIGIFGSGPSRGIWGAGGSIGVYGNGTSQGVFGSSTSSSGVGVYGSSSSYIALYGTGLYGAYGTGTAYGVFGGSSSGTGGYFSSSSSRGLVGTSSSATGMYASSGTGFGLEAHTGGSVGAYVTNSNGNGADVTGTYIGVVGRAPSTGFPIVATDSNGNNLFYVTGTGDVYYHGGIHTFAVTSTGGQALAYTAQTTTPAVQDTGTAQLVNGRAVVMLDSTFARTIDRQRTYQVFITPGGDTRGLYVASKTPSAFVVREVQGGRDTFPFDYQINAVAVGKAAERMTIVGPNARLLRRIPAREVPPEQHPKE